MRSGFYLKMAWTGIRKNKRLYIPYILTCIGMVMMFYIVAFLACNPTLSQMKGGETMQSMLSLGVGVIGIFALIFLFYTNSFLIRRRKKEFGLYNILGMGKGNLAFILIWETLIIAVISLAGGLAAGIAFSKFAELGMLNILHGEVNFSLTIDSQAIWQTLVLFAVIFALILLNTLRQVQMSKPIELLRSENAGEKPPRANWLLALVGAVLLGAAYYLAVTIEDPLLALTWFFIAVVMVIVATYLLFVAGSVMVCRILQKKKNYYYKTNHFVSISSMVYRMKRNGAGLASICILCTMVLVMLSSTVCLYIGTEDILRRRYPRNINVNVTMASPEELETEDTQQIREQILQSAAEYGMTPGNILDYRMTGLVAYLQDDNALIDEETIYAAAGNSYDGMWQLFIVPLEDYNRLMGQEKTLEEGEALLYTTKGDYKKDTITVGELDTLKIKEVVPDFSDNGMDISQVLPSMYLFVPDYQGFLAPMVGLRDEAGNFQLECLWLYGFDLEGADEEQIQVQSRIQEKMRQLDLQQPVTNWSVEGVAKERVSFYGVYGGLFFLGILLGIVFVFAAVLIMYYKQISEGYEDQSRFEIMQKVGMTKRDIRRSINSQILTVFFLPLLTAGVHLAFAFPLIYKMLILLGMTNQRLLILVTMVCFLIFALCYVLVYHITSRAYYGIVSGAREETA